MGRGGVRVGSGRKPQGAAILSLHGGRRRNRVKSAEAPPTEPQEPQKPVNCPEDLPEDQQAVWDELAPFAIQAGTLTPQTRSAFVMLCRNVVLERRLAAAPNCGDSNHRGMLQWVASRMKDFAIAPFGKPVVRTRDAKPLDPFAEFDQVVS